MQLNFSFGFRKGGLGLLNCETGMMGMAAVAVTVLQGKLGVEFVPFAAWKVATYYSYYFYCRNAT